MIKEAFFPTFVYAKDINLDLNLMTNAIVEWSKKDKGLVKTNVKGWHSPTNMHTIPVFNSLFSGAYYIKVPNNSGFLKINDPRQGTHFIKPARKDGIPIYLAPEVHIEPKENRIIMFPSWLEHCVEMNESDDIRISVSFNFLQDGFQ